MVLITGDAQRTHIALSKALLAEDTFANSRSTALAEPTARLKIFRSDAVAANSASERSSSDKNGRRERACGKTYFCAESAASVLVVDNLPLMREAIARLLTELGVPVVAVTASSIEAAAAHRQPFDLILLDLNLPGHQNFESIALMRTQRADVPVVVLSAQDDLQTILAALDNGAMGFIPKRYSHEDIASAIRIVLLGGVYVPPIDAETAATEPHEFRRRATDAVAAADPRLQRRRSTDSAATASLSEMSVPAQHLSHPEPPTLNITPRQSHVLSLLIRGLCNKSICRELSLSENTVKSHIAAIFKTLGVHNRTSAVVAMSQHGYVLAAH